MGDDSIKDGTVELDWTGEEHLEPDKFRATTIGEYKIVNDIELKKDATAKALALFKQSNYFVLGIVGVLVAIDFLHTVFLGKDASYRIINENVLMALIGATTIQLGTIVLVIFRSLFNQSDS